MMMRKIFFRLTLILMGLFLITPAYAYLDGGTGSVLIQSFLAGIAGGLALIKIYWQKIKTFFHKKKTLPQKKDNHLK